MRYEGKLGNRVCGLVVLQPACVEFLQAKWLIIARGEYKPSINILQSKHSKNSSSDCENVNLIFSGPTWVNSILLKKLKTFWGLFHIRGGESNPNFHLKVTWLNCKIFFYFFLKFASSFHFFSITDLTYYKFFV